jgi:hypothetical protein
MSLSTHLRRQNWVTPTAGQHLLDPTLSSLCEIARQNLPALLRDSFFKARSELIKAALSYTLTYRDVSALPDINRETLFILSGHQPELFHPGVWYKNAVLSRIQQQAHQSVVAINLVIDSDLVKSPAVRVPTEKNGQLNWANVDLDGATNTVPWQFRRVADLDRLASWPERMLSVAHPLAKQGLWHEYWPLLVERAKATGNLGLAIAQARHQLEASWGWQTLELPLSQLLQCPAVQNFIDQILLELPRFHTIYNQAIRDYRTEYDVSSSAHPAPLLEQSDDWYEAPLWYLCPTKQARQRVWSRVSNCQIELHTEHGTVDRQHLRPKALFTTLIARVLLSDLFIHGLGGAKYDAVTDQIIHQFFGIKPPVYAVATGTLNWSAVTEELPNLAALQQQHRTLIYHPERHLKASTDSELQALIQQKQQWVELPKSPENAAARHQQINLLNQQLRTHLVREERELQQLIAKYPEYLRRKNILESREMAFVLYPIDRLREFLDAKNP